MKYTIFKCLRFSFYIFVVLILPISLIKGRISSRLNLSQNSNYFIYEDSRGLVFISSQDGLNIYNGRENVIYRPLTHNLIGENVQSDFYEDQRGRVWFATYEALNVYESKKDDFYSYQFNDSKGQLIDFDYRLIGQYGDSLWVQFGPNTLLFNSHSLRELNRFSSNTNDDYTFDVVSKGQNFIFISGGSNGIKIKEYTSTFNLVDSNKIDFIPRELKSMNDCKIIAGSSFGELLYFDSCKKEILFNKKICGSGISKIKKVNDTTVLITSIMDGIFYYDVSKMRVVSYLLEPNEFGNEINQLLSHFKNRNNLLWLGLDGIGLHRKRITKKKFNDPITKLSEGRPITGVKQLFNGFTFVSILNGGYIILDENKSIVYENPLIENEVYNISSSFYSSKSGLIFFIGSLLYILNDDFSCEVVSFPSLVTDYPIIKMVKIGSEILCLDRKGDFYLLIISDSEIYLKKEFSSFKIEGKTSTNILSTEADFLFVSNNDEFISIWNWKNNRSSEVSRIPIKGEIKALSELIKNELYYISTVKGLFKCDILNNSCDTILDDKRLLAQTIYSIIPDGKKIWLSTNSGIILYDTVTNQTYQFTEKDGVQGLEFNTNAYHQYEDGSILMGGMNGLNYFHPDSITLSEFVSPIHVSSLLVNDELYLGDRPNVTSAYTFPYDQNTLSFSFHAIDHTSPYDTQTKFKMVGKDDNWSPGTTADGFAKYSNLEPGSYTFSILGANADGVWNAEPRNINITILPPWYATWWARTLGILLLGGFVYLTFRTYYKRQLREKDLQLREKNLIISKQKALAEERTRIAAEMHDDLGGGLTTIRFLSQKVLAKSNDHSIKKHVSKIVQQSETLVNNMSEIIWAMNAGFDTLQSLISYSRRYANRYFENYAIDLKFEVRGSTKNIKINGAKRRNVFLIIKEVLHNTVKHSKAKNVSILFDIDNSLIIRIKDDGIGLQSTNELGNGLKNMETRIRGVNGVIEFENIDGLEIILDVPLHID